MKTRREEERENIKYCKEKIATLPKKYHPFWLRQIKKSKKFLYGG